MRIRFYDVIGLIVMMLLFIAGVCGQAEAARQITEHRVIEVGDAAAVNMQIEMRAGKLQVTGEGRDLVNAAFSYPLDSICPEIEYTVSEKIGTMLIRQPEQKNQRPSIYDDYQWVLALSPIIPLNLRIKMGAGDAELDLAGMNLNALSIEMGAGDLLLDLTGYWQKSLTISVKGGAGNLHLLLPEAVGVNVQATCGIGTIELTRMNRNSIDHFSNNAYGRSDQTLYIHVEVGAGRIHLEQERWKSTQ